MFIDYYKTLGIDKTATPQDIKSAYRKLARKYHPDLNPNDKDAKSRFQQINEANEVLSDPEKRKKYDQYGQDWQHAEQYQQADAYQGRSARSGEQRSTGGQYEREFSDFFESMFGGFEGAGRSRQVKFRGQDYSTEIYLDLLQAYEANKQTLNVNDKNIRITVPAGIENGQTIKITGHGGPGVNGGPPGDLYVTFVIADHPTFKRLGNNIYTRAELDLYTAVLGGDIILDTLKGKVKLKVKPGTQNETQMKLKNKGFPVYKGKNQFGDLIVTFIIKIPAHLTDKQRELFYELSKTQS